MPVTENFRVVASLDRKRLGVKVPRRTSWTRGVFDEEASRKPLALAADAVSYGI
jgi:hypothetical protein